MSIHRTLKICWWLWALLSLPPIGYCLFKRYENKAGDVHSDWSDLWYYFHQGIWSHFGYWREIVFWSIFVPLILGWVAQYILVLAWRAWQERRRAQTVTI
jgi:hypothetical protein